MITTTKKIKQTSTVNGLVTTSLAICDLANTVIFNTPVAVATIGI